MYLILGFGFRLTGIGIQLSICIFTTFIHYYAFTKPSVNLLKTYQENTDLCNSGIFDFTYPSLSAFPEFDRASNTTGPRKIP